MDPVSFKEYLSYVGFRSRRNSLRKVAAVGAVAAKNQIGILAPEHKCSVYRCARLEEHLPERRFSLQVITIFLVRLRFGDYHAHITPKQICHKRTTNNGHKERVEKLNMNKLTSVNPWHCHSIFVRLHLTIAKNNAQSGHGLFFLTLILCCR